MLLRCTTRDGKLLPKFGESIGIYVLKREQYEKRGSGEDPSITPVHSLSPDACLAHCLTRRLHDDEHVVI